MSARRGAPLTALPLALAAGLALAAPLPREPSFVVVLTDDQRWDTLWAMPFVDSELRPRARDFRQAFVTTPECCPSRASFLSGGFYAHNTGVLTNSGPNGGAARFDDRRAMPVQLQQAGYTTALIGKYMNGYDQLAPRVPAGWDHFVATTGASDWRAFDVVFGSSRAQPTLGRREHRREHVVAFEIAQALAFLDGVGPGPFFLVVSVEAPHAPATPLPEDVGLHAGYRYRDRSYGEQRRRDKPRFIRRLGAEFAALEAERDAFHRDQLRSLAAVDRGIAAIHQRLAASGRLASTVLVVTSDNGYLWGEHRLEGKNLPYDEALRVPLLVLGPGVEAGPDEELVAMNLDVPATILDLSGLYPNERALGRHTDGASLRPLLESGRPGAAGWRQDLLIESYGRPFAGLLSRVPYGEALVPPGGGWAWKYVEHRGGKPREAYRADADPWEMENLARTAAFRRVYLAPLARRLAELRGLALTTGELAPARAGALYRATLEAVGGGAPYAWEVVAGGMPPGLALGRQSGILEGTPARAGTFRFAVAVEGQRQARYLRRPQRFVRELTLRVDP